MNHAYLAAWTFVEASILVHVRIRERKFNGRCNARYVHVERPRISTSRMRSDFCGHFANQVQQTSYRSFRQRNEPMQMHSICDDVSPLKRDVVCTGLSDGQKDGRSGRPRSPTSLVNSSSGSPTSVTFLELFRVIATLIFSLGRPTCGSDFFLHRA